MREYTANKCKRRRKGTNARGQQNNTVLARRSRNLLLSSSVWNTRKGAVIVFPTAYASRVRAKVTGKVRRTSNRHISHMGGRPFRRYRFSGVSTELSFNNAFICSCLHVGFS